MKKLIGETNINLENLKEKNRELGIKVKYYKLTADKVKKD